MLCKPYILLSSLLSHFKFSLSENTLLTILLQLTSENNQHERQLFYINLFHGFY